MNAKQAKEVAEKESLKHVLLKIDSLAHEGRRQLSLFKYHGLAYSADTLTELKGLGYAVLEMKCWQGGLRREVFYKICW